MVFPKRHWAEATPESQCVDAGKLHRAMRFLAGTCGGHGTDQAVVIRNGYLIWRGPDIDNTHNIWSCTKVFTSTVLGLLIDDGVCTLDTLANDYVPELADAYPTLTLRHFTTMTSGYNADGGDQSRTPFIASAPLFTPPGAACEYWDAAMNTFAYTLTAIHRGEIREFFKMRIADPIGIDPTRWNWGNLGTLGGHLVNGGAGNAARGIEMSAAELARFGHLFLNRGNWNGAQLISAQWVAQATSRQVPLSTPWHGQREDVGGVYGFNWWVQGRRRDGTATWPGAPSGAFAAKGFNNNKCFVIPEWQMVIVRLGTDGSIEDRCWGAFLQHMGEALIPGETSTGTEHIQP